MINAEDILRRLTADERKSIDGIDCFDEIDSTNDWLMTLAPPAPGRFQFAIADEQTAGRGQHDRSWASPKGAGLYLSMAYTFAETPRHLQALTLALGASVADALLELGVVDVALKWPNDIMARDGKLGGILAEARSQQGRFSNVVVGLGLNVDLPNALREQLEAERTVRVSDLQNCLDAPPPLDELAAIVIHSLVKGSNRYSEDASGEWRDAWQRYDWLQDKGVYIEQLGGPVVGTAEGIDKDGALLVRTKGQVVRVVSGTVALQRPMEGFA